MISSHQVRQVVTGSRDEQHFDPFSGAELAVITLAVGMMEVSRAQERSLDDERP